MGPAPRCRLALLLALSGGCTATTPEIAELDDFDDPPTLADRDWAVPDGEREPAPSTEISDDHGSGAAPRIHLRRAGERDRCSRVQSRGFPAIDEHGEIAIPLAHILMLSDRPGRLDLAWLGTDGSTRTDPILTERDDYGDDEACARLHRNTDARARRANTALASRTWRPLERLPVELGSRDAYDADAEAELPADQRPVQALVQHRQLIVRIPGVRVLERHDLEVGGDFVHRVYADRDSGTALVVLGACEGEDCTCDPGFTAQRVQLVATTFAAIDEHPCVPAGDEHTCDLRPLPFGEPWEPWEI